MKFLFFSILILLNNLLFATTFKIGSSQTYASPNALYQANVIDHGDTIQIYGGTYSGTDALAHWNKDNLIIQGIGDRPHLVADGAYILGKGIWVLSGDDISVSNIEFSGATVPDMNGAGIRLDGTGLKVSHCYFHHNENGILTGSPFAGYILIQYSEFAYNGFGDGFSHNLYVNHVDRLEFRFNYTHHANVGHCLKSRANENIIIANRIMDEETGNSSRLIDISNGGISVIMGNVLMQGPQAENNNMIGYGLEGLSNPVDHKCLIVNNTLVNKREASCRFLHLANDTEVAWAYNNIFAGTGQIIEGSLDADVGNLVETNIDALYFADEINYDYQLTDISPAIDIGTIPPDPNVNNVVLYPGLVYLHPANGTTRPESGPLDAGAYEFEQAMNANELHVPKPIIFPNPVMDLVKIPSEFIGAQYFISNIRGEFVKAGTMQQDQLELLALNPGLYFLSFHIDQKILTYKIQKL